MGRQIVLLFPNPCCYYIMASIVCQCYCFTLLYRAWYRAIDTATGAVAGALVVLAHAFSGKKKKLDFEGEGEWVIQVTDVVGMMGVSRARLMVMLRVLRIVTTFTSMTLARVWL
jgi:hypothetical protein